jgi:hypothetical protein
VLPFGYKALRLREMLNDAAQEHDAEEHAGPPLCRTGVAAFTVVIALGHLKPSAMAAGGAASIPRSLRSSDDGFAT